MTIFSRRRIWIGLIVLAMAGLIYFVMNGEGDRLWSEWIRWIRQDAPATTIIALFLTLPLVGFPISPFLLLLGAKFNAGPAIVIMFAAMAVHQGITYPAGNTFLRPLIADILARRNVSLPQLPEHGYMWPSILFIAVPGLSYTMKNYILALSGIPFRDFFWISWLIQAVMGIPMVLAGEAVGGRHFPLLVGFFLLLVAFYGFRLWLRRERRRHK